MNELSDLYPLKASSLLHRHPPTSGLNYLQSKNTVASKLVSLLTAFLIAKSTMHKDPEK